MANAIGQFWTLYQGKDMHNITFLKRFNTIVEVIEQQGGTIEGHNSLIELEEEDEAEEVSKEKFLAICFIKKACRV
eukprot:7512493-Ditylum_brightwellii.AAC.1